MSDGPRRDDKEDESRSSDPYGYLSGAGDDAAGYLPSDVARERPLSVPDEDRAAPTSASEASGQPDDGPLEITVGMTRRELRELRARRAERAAAAAAADDGPGGDGVAEVSGADDDARGVRDDEATGESGAKAGEGRDGAWASTWPVPATPAAPTAPSAFGTAGESDAIAGAAGASAANGPWGSPATPASSPESIAPGWHDPAARRRGGRRTLWIVLGVAVVLAAAIAVVLTLVLGGSSDEPEPQPTTTTAQEEATGLAALLPATVVGGVNSEDGSTGVTYTLTEAGLVENPVPPQGATESLTGEYTGGEVPVSLTASSFASTEEALAAATAQADQLGTPVDTGVVFPDDDLGTYWIFNTDGLVTIVWNDGAEGAYTVVSEETADALGFYNGLEF
ncbi:hypothetical protein [Litorihabitans aurantiacus]|uniref:Uncharacterized protein n=1 Tax=Litorihabitans aurantiacus TaxID=1930061 RepID=A0AA37UHC4_9MICO|nr:hypothetical protein [Litorihabitans aurantiacus]GMA30678.1 hypothetical protein GCM10025875_06700 [Litorihabitans aurantiacus]